MQDFECPACSRVLALMYTRARANNAYQCNTAEDNTAMLTSYEGFLPTDWSIHGRYVRTRKDMLANTMTYV